ncbi:hypothetical protein GCM10010260_19590 [Streptomyces filipinensis]|uniref:Uncharacterized protein n=1 Tax=Streptomyces filipinensis TaxID=66887 RepID=A0A918MAL5_9ACTN|nr:hypothetical protein GCM10010260_19590 [Streptomyces filipinensis]
MRLAGALKDALRRRGPAPVDIVTDPDALSVPPRISAEMVTGFALPAGLRDRAGRRGGPDAPDGPRRPA